MPNGQMPTATVTKTRAGVKTIALVGLGAVATAALLGLFTANFAILATGGFRIAATTISCATSDNLVSNCSFESGVSGIIADNSTVSKYPVYTKAYSGTAVALVKMNETSDGFKGGIGTYHVIGSSNTPLQPNTQYELSSQLRSDHSGEEFDDLYVAAVINGSKVIKGSNVATDATGNESWHESKVKFTTPANGGSVALYYGWGQGPDARRGRYWVDDVSLKSTATTSLTILGNYHDKPRPIPANSHDVILADFDFTARGEPMRIEKMYISARQVNNGGWDQIDQLYLYQGNQLIKSVTPTVSDGVDQVVFVDISNNPITAPLDSPIRLTFKGDTANYGTGFAGTLGEGLYLFFEDPIAIQAKGLFSATRIPIYKIILQYGARGDSLYLVDQATYNLYLADPGSFVNPYF